MKQQTLETLKSARIKLEQGWTQVHFALDIDGYSVLSSSPAATHFCLLGAVSLFPNFGEAIQEMMLTLGLGNDMTLAVWNDDPLRTKEEVLACLDQTIERLEKELTI
jgi:hypothetical protein